MPAISSNGQFSSPQHGAIPTTPTMPATSPGNSSSASHNAGTSNWRGTSEIADAGGFFHVLHNVAQVDSAVDASLSCLLGLLSGLSSAAAGTLLACVCRVSMSVGGFTNMDGISERALAAEAALQAVLRLEPSPEKGEVIHKMQIIWSINAPNLERLTSRLALALTQCALDIAVHRLSQTSDPRRMRGLRQLSAPKTPTLVVVGEEELLGWLESVLEVAVSDEAPLVSQATRSALASIVTKLLGDSEFIPTQPQRDKDATLVLFNRAMMADVALRALMDLPRQSLSRIDLKGREGQNMFDFIKTCTREREMSRQLETSRQSDTPHQLEYFYDRAAQVGSTNIPEDSETEAEYYCTSALSFTTVLFTMVIVYELCGARRGLIGRVSHKMPFMAFLQDGTESYPNNAH
ncbi:hypothetical protein BKA56DRAFT_676406 [Ilyonectria sp. MPI-CAGE-AT-0026]|nr:hypothetical protein BKA56DRAFT_676406 [Ilyonectria sp. MPI-CAGE-AT-0026]